MTGLPKWGRRLLFLTGLLFGLFLVMAVTLQVPAVGKAIGGAEACGTCHFMGPEITSLQRSAHGDLSCLDCHSAKGFWHKPADELKSASVHIWVTLTHTEPDVVRLTESGRRNMQANCQACHSDLVQHVVLDSRQCTDCHRATPHDRPNLGRN